MPVAAFERKFWYFFIPSFPGIVGQKMNCKRGKIRGHLKNIFAGAHFLQCQLCLFLGLSNKTNPKCNKLNSLDELNSLDDKCQIYFRIVLSANYSLSGLISSLSLFDVTQENSLDFMYMIKSEYFLGIFPWNIYLEYFLGLYV